MASFRREFDRFFDSFIEREPGELAQRRWIPEVDVVETPEEITVKADIPGMEEKDLTVTLSENNLILKGEKKKEKEEKDKHYHRVERSRGMFERIVPIPVSVDQAKISVEYKKGVMEVHLPKMPEAKSKAIPIKVKKEE